MPRDRSQKQKTEDARNFITTTLSILAVVPTRDGFPYRPIGVRYCPILSAIQLPDLDPSQVRRRFYARRA